MRKPYRLVAILTLALIMTAFCAGCGSSETEVATKYELAEVHPVAGRQGICTENGCYWVSGSGRCLL